MLPSEACLFVMMIENSFDFIPIKHIYCQYKARYWATSFPTLGKTISYHFTFLKSEEYDQNLY